jgi:hypothetical protein
MRAMSIGVKTGLKIFLPTAATVGLLLLVWPYWELLVVLWALVGFCVVGYYGGKLRSY